MATYVNDLRLKEITTGDESGTWGTSTNTNLELIAEAFSYGTEVITTNADTHTTTIADGSTDPGRSLYLKYTGTLDSACTITIGPDTVSKVWIIENGTSGSQDIILSQGSGANITIPAGDTKVVYSDGAGAGAAFFDAFANLKVTDPAQTNITSVGTLTNFTSTGIDDNADATAITIDSSERVIVGNTSPFTADSVTIDQGGFLAIRNTSASGMEVRRDSTNGSLIDFQKDGSAVGSISVDSGYLHMGQGSTNLLFVDTGQSRVIPRGTVNTASDGFIDLGDSGSRFKDLYLSGGVYLGGTGAANHLDDYEEGTWTPTGISAGTLDFARYTKIGDVVFLYLNVSGSITLTNGTIGGLPFSAVTTSCPWYFADFAVGAGEIPMPTIAGTNILLRTADQATGAISTLGDLTGSYISITATYHV
jgi:hypothetical protein